MGFTKFVAVTRSESLLDSLDIIPGLMVLFSNLAALRVFQMACLVTVYMSMSWSVKGVA